VFAACMASVCINGLRGHVVDAWLHALARHEMHELHV
jgi:hypothetical protein